MLPAPGVTRSQPFTDSRVDKPELYRALFRMIVRAYGRVRPDDLSSVDEALDESPYAHNVRNRTAPPVDTKDIAAQLESLIKIFAKNAPYVLQPGALQSQPPGPEEKHVLREMLDEASAVLKKITASRERRRDRGGFHRRRHPGRPNSQDLRCRRGWHKWTIR